MEHSQQGRSAEAMVAARDAAHSALHPSCHAKAPAIIDGRRNQNRDPRRTDAPMDDGGDAVDGAAF